MDNYRTFWLLKSVIQKNLSRPVYPTRQGQVTSDKVSVYNVATIVIRILKNFQSMGVDKFSVSFWALIVNKIINYKDLCVSCIKLIGNAFHSCIVACNIFTRKNMAFLYVTAFPMESILHLVMQPATMHSSANI